MRFVWLSLMLLLQSIGALVPDRLKYRYSHLRTVTGKLWCTGSSSSSPNSIANMTSSYNQNEIKSAPNQYSNEIIQLNIPSIPSFEIPLFTSTNKTMSSDLITLNYNNIVSRKFLMGSILTNTAAINELKRSIIFPSSPLLDYSLFKQYIQRLVSRKFDSDKEFRDNINVRDLKRQHIDSIQNIDNEVVATREIFENSVHYDRICELEHRIVSCSRAVESIERFILDGKSEQNGDKMNRVGELLPVKKAELFAATQELDVLCAETPAFAMHKESLTKQRALYTNIGLIGAVSTANSSSYSGGKGRNARGKTFEDVAELVLREHLVPMLSRLHGVAEGELLVLRNVKIGGASLKGTTSELDCVICLPKDGKITSSTERSKQKQGNSIECEVLAVIEVKRNADDLGEVFMKYQRTLAWLCGDTINYNPEHWISKAFPQGHFDKPITHSHNGARVNLSPESFVRICRTAVNIEKASNHLINLLIDERTPYNIIQENCVAHLFIEQLFFVSRSSVATPLESVSSKAVHWLLSKVSTECSFDNELNDDTVLEELRQRVIVKCPYSLCTSELLAIYEYNKIEDQLFIVSHKNAADDKSKGFADSYDEIL